jgi:ketosteroid isomerase-like protein
METVKQSKEIVKGFFNAFGKGDFNGIIGSFHDSCTIMAVRKANRTGSQIYGTYQGREGAKTFISKLGMFLTQSLFG